VIQIAGKLGMKVRQKRVSRKELTSADEIFLTSSIAELLPVVKVDNFKIGLGAPGPITKLLHVHYKRVI